jgi:hypothetical protein
MPEETLVRNENKPDVTFLDGSSGKRGGEETMSAKADLTAGWIVLLVLQKY